MKIRVGITTIETDAELAFVEFQKGRNQVLLTCPEGLEVMVEQIGATPNGNNTKLRFEHHEMPHSDIPKGTAYSVHIGTGIDLVKTYYFDKNGEILIKNT